MKLEKERKQFVKFNSYFEWGAAFSGPQTENDKLDGRTNNVWDKWFKEEPQLFWKNEFVLTNYRKDYKKIIAMAKEIGLKALRTSIQWSRLMPNGKNVSNSAVQYYRNLFGEMKANGIKPIACLMHFDVPMFLHRKGGFENKNAPAMFANYAKKAFDLLGDIVDTWFTFNEPFVSIESGYLGKNHKPQIVDMKRAMQTQHNYLMAHLKVVSIYRKNHKGNIGIILNIIPAIPKDKSKSEIIAANWANIFNYKSFLDVIIWGKYPKILLDDAKKNNYLWEITSSDQELMKKYSRIDVLGINYYTPFRTQAIPDVEKKPWSNHKAPNEQYFKIYNHKKAIINKHRGWEIFPSKIYDLLMAIKNEYANQKTFISENGIGISNEQQFRQKNGIINDHYRIKFIKDHLHYVSKAIKAGSNCFGYHIWTLVDNWSWLNSYKNRYGLIEFNKEDKKFYPKKSALWFKKLINNSFEDTKNKA